MIRSDSQTAQSEAARIISTGGVIAFRTDTFYGLGADPLNSAAVAKIRKLKGREDNKPILVLISDMDQLDRFVGEKSGIFGLVAVGHWPAPLTLIGPARPELPLELTAGSNTIGVRLPDDENVRALTRACGGALTATSANVSGEPPARTAKEVEEYFPTGIDLIIDGGEVTATEPSTVLDLSEAEPRLVREGAIPRAALRDLLK
ncbi:MAG: L-threonylcarbamoyladenylate synthase [Pyrinomonadaceae bacterium]|jgi:L-threonylcarbamoyladenylate synthase|nr:L-threonylcarbamoyladenylate synthase [Pyrinomonadaceae bacterium]